MYGFSVYLGETLNDSTLVYINSMKRAGFSGVFTSLHIPEDDAGELMNQLLTLRDACKQSGLALVADVSRDGFERMGIDYTDAESLTNLGLAGLRLDFGFTNTEIAAMSRVLPVALNASTLTENDLSELKTAGANMQHVEAWHNYYPRPETGLDADWYLAKNQWLHEQGITTMGFVPGDDTLRLPLRAGLPTLEAHRNRDPLACALNLDELATDKIYIGDNTITEATQSRFAAYLQRQVLQLRTIEPLPNSLKRVWHNRPDVARDVVRLEESRGLQLLSTVPDGGQERLAGSVTVDNDDYGRYHGEIQIVRHHLPVDARVNVIGQLDAASVALLPYVGAGTAIEFL